MALNRMIVCPGLIVAVLVAAGTGRGRPYCPEESAKQVRIRLLAVGDINLGRLVGQHILKGDTLFPFAGVRDTLKAYDVVFGNLESPLSDRNGETQSPENNLIFTGPPAGAEALVGGGVQVVSTANNHALDYGLAGLRETVENLRRAGLAFVGTSGEIGGATGPVILERGGIRLAFFACTDIMNRPGEKWKLHVSAADTGVLLPKIRTVRTSVDLVVVSYHGGDEYADRPAKRVLDFAQAALRAGAALVLGHHPHVPYGVMRIRGGLVAPSLGNFVFRQPARFWTQRSFALSVTIEKDSLGTRIGDYRVLPLLAGLRPTFDLPRADRDTIDHRVRALSSSEGMRLVP